MVTLRQAESIAAGRATAAIKNNRKDLRRFFGGRPLRPTTSPNRRDARRTLVNGYVRVSQQLVEAAVQAVHREASRQVSENGRVRRRLRVSITDPVTGTRIVVRSVLKRLK